MKAKKRSVIFCLMMSFASLAIADVFESLNPIIGIDYQYRNIKAKGSAGSDGLTTNLFNKTFEKSNHGVNFYVGSRFHDYLGFELGYAQSATEKKDYTSVSGDSLFALRQVAPGTKFHSELRFKSWHADLNGYFPLNELTSNGQVDLIGTIGLSYVKPDLRVFSINDVSLSTKTEYRVAPRIGGGAQFRINEYFGIRGLIRWEHTSRLTLILSSVRTKPFKNSLTANFGIFATI